MPFQTGFWEKPQHIPSAVAGLNNIKGFITALPVEWTKRENIKIDYPTALIVRNDSMPVSGSKDTRLGQNSINKNDEAAG
jgi:phospholipase D1/2